MPEQIEKISPTEELNIIRLSSGKSYRKKDCITKEIPFTILVNGQEIVTLLCSPHKLEYLAVGFLLSESLVKNNILIKGVGLGKDGYYANVKVDGDLRIPQDLFRKRLISSGCGRGPSFYNSQDITDCRPVNSDLHLNYGQIIDLMRAFQAKSSLFKKTGGVHSAALSSPHEIEVFAEDIGRHNAIDKIFGECFLKDIPTRNKIILTSGRISSEIVIKVAKRKTPIIISRSAPTDLAVRLAEKTKLSIIGFARGKRMNIYTHNFRVK
ncbi:MAG: formate dehydrogenase accessory sulfurtransferase FdhD [bacterium]